MVRHTTSRRSTRRAAPALLIFAIITAALLLANCAPRVVSLFSVSTASADTFEPPSQTEIVRVAPARPPQQRAGACATQSAYVPRSDAWACTVHGAAYDPCFAAPNLDGPSAVVCGAEPLSGAEGFVVEGAAPPALTMGLPVLDRAAFYSMPVTIDLIGAPVTLVKGQFYAPNVERTGGSVLVALSEMQALGDLDGDGDDDAAGLLVADAGDGRMFIYLYAVRNQDGMPIPAGAVELGDRVKVDALEIENGQIIVTMTTHTGDDPACCPTLDVVYAYNLVGDRVAQYTDGWRLELQGGIQCLPVQGVQRADGSAPFSYQCSNGLWLHNGLTPGRVWYAQTVATVGVTETPADRDKPDYIPVVRIWQ